MDRLKLVARNDAPWEQGSGFHWVPLSTYDSASVDWGRQRLYGTGRQALAALLNHGTAERGWRRLWLPAYYCPETSRATVSLLESDLEICEYDCGPLNHDSIPQGDELTVGDVILVVNYFGLGSSTGILGGLPVGVDTIEDHTHDPWSEWASQSLAQYGFASLRKTMPIPDGGVVWSPRGESLPASARRKERHECGAALRLEAMLLKSLYLSGRPVAKSAYLDLERRSEDLLGAGPIAAPSAISESLIPMMPVLEWRESRVRNFRRLVGRLEKASEVTVLHPGASNGASFSVVLLLRDRSERDRLTSFLINERVYPAVLWELAPSLAASFSDQSAIASRLLSIHCDFRFNDDDMDRVADVVVRGLRA